MNVLYWFAAYILIGSLFTLVGTVILEKREEREYVGILVPCAILWPLSAPLFAAYAVGKSIARKCLKGGAGYGAGK